MNKKKKMNTYLLLQKKVNELLFSNKLTKLQSKTNKFMKWMSNIDNNFESKLKKEPREYPPGIGLRMEKLKWITEKILPTITASKSQPENLLKSPLYKIAYLVVENKLSFEEAIKILGSVLNFVYEMKREGGDSKIPPDGNEYHQEVQHE